MAENITVDPKDAQDNKVMAILAYLGFPLVLVPILAAKESPFARYHANQGIILCIAGMALGFVVSILMFILLFIAPALSVIAYLVTIILPVLAVLGIINAVKGECKPLPIIGNLFTIIK